jgi:hypothetical protein
MQLSLGLAACLTLASSQALPSPLVTPSAPKSEVTVIHHKPGHHEGHPGHVATTTGEIATATITMTGVA